MSENLQLQNPSTTTELLLNQREAAAFLNISRMTLLRGLQADKISFYRLGFRICYSKQPPQDFLAAWGVGTFDNTQKVA